MVAALTITEATANVGDTINASGTGYTPLENIDFTFNGVAINAVEGTITSDVSGEWTASFVVPEVPNGARSLVGTDQTLLTANDSVTINAEITLTPSTSSPTATVQIDGTGFAAEEEITITFDTDPIVTDPVTVTTDVNGSFTCDIVVPSVAAGNYTVDATDESTNTDSATLAVQTVPGQPNVTVQTVTGTTVQLSWPAPDDGDSSITGYTVEHDTTSLFSNPTATPVAAGSDPTVAVISGLLEETTYYFRVKATNAIGNSAWSATDTATTDDEPTEPTSYNGADQNRKSQDLINPATIAVDNDNMVKVMIIDNHDYAQNLLHIINTHATNGLTYNIYGHNNPNLATPGNSESGVPPVFSTTTWAKLVAADVAVAAVTASKQLITEPWWWLCVVMKRTSSGQSATAEIYSIGRSE